jgi:hypothetical protein
VLSVLQVKMEFRRRDAQAIRELLLPAEGNVMPSRLLISHTAKIKCIQTREPGRRRAGYEKFKYSNGMQKY